ncbi:hypothetical protein C923_03909 [Plasmodium falciparum UGT5.1]|uniref:Duffy-binding-like domain-containing protein n=2 Tax=Plasmodium falciparum TaxID=5833 RepID=W7JKC7_PLAFA|nr:hypothetical protein C923_03909 [Plasmodium falciparum UGT5.1]
MAPQPTAPDYTNVKDAKDLLDRIGQQVYNEKVKNDAEKYKEALKGNLQKAKVMGERVSTDKPCALVKEYYERVNKGGGNGEWHPCKNLKGSTNEERFSDKIGGQCTKEKIEGNTYIKGKDVGACAPYRRLHLCHHNLENIKDVNNIDNDTLLAEVCMAAKFEAESLKTYRGQYQLTNPGSQICTVLARSFADIGDIVRGKDLYLGNPQEKEQRDKLEKNLKKIFGDIYEELKKHKKLKEEAQKRYNGDEDKNFFKLREDWWNANRETVWKAMTCSEDLKNSSYFRNTCNDSGTLSHASNKCRCKDKNGQHETDQVPTYFDYVPQFLRWFEEWAEDFCRLRKHKLKDAKQQCREKVKDGKELYCDLNRYDCTKTASGKHDFFEEDNCKYCHFSCSHFVKWIDNQKLEFLKQREKYKSEITGGGASGRSSRRKKRSSSSSSSYDNVYENYFYEKLKEVGYQDVDSFLEKLNKEKDCENIKDTEGGKIDFKNVHSGKNSGGGDSGTNVESQGTFYRTTYCEACPWCGAEKESGGKGWKAKNDDECGQGKEYKGYKKTDIPILTGDKTKSDMVKKYNKFCNGNGGNGAPATANGGENGKKGDNKEDNQIKTWQCYYKKNEKDVGKKDINFCVLQDENVNKKGQKVTSYNAFFWDWVHDMLHDSLEWRERLNSCINNESKPCKNNKCNKDCDCFLKWVDQKKETEWEKIKEHFGKQDFASNVLLGKGLNHDFVLNYLLDKEELLKNIKDTHADAKDIDRIKKLLDDEEKDAAGGSPVTGKNSIIDKLLQHEEDEATKCKKCKQPEESVLRSAGPPREDTLPPDQSEHDHSESEEEEEEAETEEAETEEEEKAEKAVEVKETPPEDQVDGERSGPKKDEVDACGIVATLFSDKANLEKACEQKYSGNNSRLGWKCIPTNTNDVATGKSDTGGLCIPPRRRRLYVGKLTEWAATVNGNKEGSESGSGSQGSRSDSSSSSSSDSSQGTTSPSPSDPRADDLREAFIESAAIETFFLWHEYKKQKEKKPQEGGLPQLLPLSSLPGTHNEDPQTLLQSGKIPDGFLRQMFYTLADYRDICIGVKDNDVIEALKSSADEKIEELQNKIKDIIQKPNGDSTSPRGSRSQNSVKSHPNSGKTPEEWWDEIAPSIWNAMVCALTYKENSSGGEKGTPKVVKIENAETLLDKIKEENGKEGEYHYSKVELKEENETKAKGPQDGLTPQTTHLSKFVLRPPYFRYLHEWGEEFCRNRKMKIDKIINECRGEFKGQKYCGGDGHICDKTDTSHNDTFIDLHCPGCLKECIKYKRWIEKKEKEFNEQKSIYQEEKQKLTKGNNCSGDDKKFCEKLKENSYSFYQFLNELKHCKDSKNNTDENNQEDKDNKLDFNNNNKTFGPSTYCKACPIYGVKYNRGTYTAIEESEYKKKNGSLENDKDKKPTKIDVLVLGRKGEVKDNDNNLNNACKNTGLFEHSSLQKWICQYVNKIDQCNLTNFATDIDHDKNMKFNVFFQRWLRNFVHDYNKLKHIIHPCIKKGNGKEDKCIKECNNKCECVKEWLEIKEKEWENITKHYNKRKSIYDYDIPYWVKSYFVEQLHFDSDYKKAQDVVESKDERERYKLWGCTGDNIENRDKKTCEDGDFITNLISKLQNKIHECKTKHDETPPNTCDDFPTQTYIEPLDPNDDNLVDDAQHRALRFCPKVDICKDGKVDCTKVGKGNSKLIQVPIDPDNTNGKTHRNNDGDKSNCAGIRTIKSEIKWKNNEDREYKHLGNMDKGVYISPRRQKLCVRGLEDAKDEIQLKEKLLTAAANDAYNLAIKYNDYKDNYTVPPCHALKYSFYDYKYIILGDDPLESENGNIGSALKRIFEKDKRDDGKRYSDERKQFWETNKYCVWEAMKCGYKEGEKIGKKSGKTSAPDITNCENTPNEFDGVPQFFMWFTEWGEDFCKQRKKQFDILKDKCDKCDVQDGTCDNENECAECKTQCEEYKKWIETWKENYKKQNEVYNEVKKTKPYNEDSDVKASDDARVYLDTQLKNMTCTNGSTNENCNYTCMKNPSTENSSKNIPESLDDEPKEVKEKCNCFQEKCRGLSVTDSGFTDGHAFGGGIPKRKCKGLEGGFPQKSVPPASDSINDILKTTIPIGISLALGSIAFLFMKKKPKSPVDLIRVLDIPKGDYGIPTPKSSNRYIPYRSGTYKGKTYIYMEGDSGTDSGYTDHYSDITSSESEYEELDINDIYVPGSPKYKTLIEVVLEPSGNNTTASGNNTTASGKNTTASDTQNDIQNDGIPSSKITDNEWNTLKDDFISNMLQNEPNTEPNILHDNLDNNTHPTMSRDNMEEKPFIMSIHDRNLYTGEEYNYNVNMSTNNVDIPINRNNNVYSGIDLINDSLSGEPINIYDEVLKRKENELFGTNHTKKNTSTNSVAKLTNSDPIHNQLELFHKWLDRHRDMCEKWDTNNKVDILNQLKEEWENDNSNSGNKTSGNITPTSDIPSGKLSDIPSTNKMLNSDVSIQIHIDKPNQVDDNIYLDTYPDKYTVDNINPVDTHTNPNLVGNINPVDQNSNLTFPSNPNPAYDNIYIDHNNEDLPSKVQIEMSVKNGEMAKEK